MRGSETGLWMLRDNLQNISHPWTNILRKQVPNVDVTNVTIAGEIVENDLKVNISHHFSISVYTFSHEKGEPMPYRIKIPTKNVTLRHVKDFLPKKGAFR